MKADTLMKDSNINQGMYVCAFKSKEKRQLELQKSTYLFKKSLQFNNLFVKGLEPGTTPEEVESYFAEYGTIKSIKVMSEVGRAFVCFEERNSAKMAKENARNKTFNGKVLFIDYCEPKELR